MPELTRRRQADQASGLRRLFGTRSAQIVALVSAFDPIRRAPDGVPLVLKTASCLIRNDMSVVVMDEHAAAASIFASFGLRVPHDLLDVIDARHTANEISVEGPSGLRLVGASRFASDLSYVDALAEQRLDSALAEWQQGSDFMMLDCVTRTNGDVSPLAVKAHHVAVLVTPQSAAITRAYALIKRLAKSRDGHGIDVVVSNARSRGEARAVFKNLQDTASKHLGIRLGCLGDATALATDGIGDLILQRLMPADSKNRSSPDSQTDERSATEIQRQESPTRSPTSRPTRSLTRLASVV